MAAQLGLKWEKSPVFVRTEITHKLLNYKNIQSKANTFVQHGKTIDIH